MRMENILDTIPHSKVEHTVIYNSSWIYSSSETIYVVGKEKQES